MSKKDVSLAFDFGASSGRLMMSSYNGNTISLEELHRFENVPVTVGNRIYWDLLRLYHELKIGLKKASALDVNVVSIGIDTWGVDYALLNKHDELLCNPIHYRDSRTKDILSKVEEKMPFSDIYKTTGNQYMPLNTLYQLYHDTFYRPDIVEQAESLLFMPDMFNFLLTGNKYNEYTIASTSQMLDCHNKTWATDILEKLNIKTTLLKNIIKPGEIYGYLHESVCQEVGLKGKIPVVAVGSHDTASAVAATPLKNQNQAYLCSGTWSLLGIESDKPIISHKSHKFNFTNEGGVGGTIRFLKNLNGLWLIQQLKAKWEHLGIDYSQISKQAQQTQNDYFIIDPSHKSFMAPFDMATEIQHYCQANNQGTPKTIGEISRAAYNGLASQYKQTLEQLENIIGADIETLHMVGGGIQDEFLCQHTANICGKKVMAGPVESSVLGNIMMQLIAIGSINSIKEGRQLIVDSFTMKEYYPKNR